VLATFIRAMAKKIILELTEAQFLAMIDLADTISAQRGCDLDFTDESDKNLRLFDRMLKKKGY
jgi:hypothetical protein